MQIKKIDNCEKNNSLKSKLLAEVFGTFLLIFGGLGVGMLISIQENPMPVSVAFGLSLMISLFLVGKISGGHFNPAVTLAMIIAKRFELKNMLPYMTAQFLGGFIAISILYAITIDNSLINADTRLQLFMSLTNQFGEATKIKFGLFSALLVEAIATSIFLAVIMLVNNKFKVDKCAKSLMSSAFIISITLMLMIQVSLPITNASLNPVRSTVTALMAPPALNQLWAFWIGPLLGSIITGITFRFINKNAD